MKDDVPAEAQRDFEAALASRDIIGQAKGMLMYRFRIDADEAFELLRGASQREQRKLHEVASDLVESFLKMHRNEGND